MQEFKHQQITFYPTACRTITKLQSSFLLYQPWIPASPSGIPTRVFHSPSPVTVPELGRAEKIKYFQLKIKEGYYIGRLKLELNKQVEHVSLTLS